MPRKARIDAPGALHHVIIRGIERKPVFKNKADRLDFLDRVEKIFIETSTPCFAWALLTNHAHFLMRTGKAPLSTGGIWGTLLYILTRGNIGNREYITPHTFTVFKKVLSVFIS